MVDLESEIEVLSILIILAERGLAAHVKSRVLHVAHRVVVRDEFRRRVVVCDSTDVTCHLGLLRFIYHFKDLPTLLRKHRAVALGPVGRKS